MPKGDWARPVRIDAPPVPMKNTVSMPMADQRSLSQPAGKAHTPKAMKPGSEYGKSSPYGRSKTPSSATTTVAYSSMKMCE